MNKIFAIYSKVLFEDEEVFSKLEIPEFFKDENNKPYESHVTLKQPVYIDEKGIDNVKKILSDLDLPKTKIAVVFNKIEGDREVLMIMADNNDTLIKLQKDVCGSLSGYDSYVESETEEYEKNFRPHITVAMNINEDKFDLIKSRLEIILPIRAYIESVNLAMVEGNSSENADLVEYKF